MEMPVLPVQNARWEQTDTANGQYIPRAAGLADSVCTLHVRYMLLSFRGATSGT